MSTQKVMIPADLLCLKPSDDLESVSISSLARKGTTVLRQMIATAEAVSVKIQGQGAMVTLSQHQYDEIVDLVRQIKEGQSEDDFTRTLGHRFDDLVASMNGPCAAEATKEALFGDPASLNKSYRPGTTERDD